ncbi:MAG: c-type cytochrome [Geminicoccaceae bacterium]|nr:c-type cytochrome [Geminicoccaceae bacterium]
MRLVILAALSLCLGVPAAPAADPRLVALGREIAEGAALGPDYACSRCHGVLGRGRPEGEAPRIAAQPAFYLEKQLHDFAEGTRRSAKMAPVARALSDEQRAAVAAYYGSLWWVPYPEAPYAEPSLVQRGGILSAIGDAERGIGACEICHADAGVGIAPSFPYLAGQHADYTERQLSLWKAGVRRNDPLDVMAEIARRLEDEEIRALALYFARVRPPPAALSSPIPAEPIPPPPTEPSVPD